MIYHGSDRRTATVPLAIHTITRHAVNAAMIVVNSCMSIISSISSSILTPNLTANISRGNAKCQQ